MNMNIITLANFKRIPSVSIYDDEVLVVRANDIPYIPKPAYPVRIKYFVFVYCASGTVDFTIDVKRYEIHERQFLLTSSDCVMEFNDVRNFKGAFLVVSHNYMKSLTTTLSAIWKRLAVITKLAVHDVTEQESLLVNEYIDRLASYNKREDMLFRREVVLHQIISFLHELCCFKSVANIEESINEIDRNQEIFGEFMALVIHHFRKEHSVGFYADRMNITAKYLSIAVKNATNKTPSDCIQKYLIQESKVLLKNTDMSIKEIVSELNFPTATFFCRYFKRNTGLSPMKYRNMPMK